MKNSYEGHGYRNDTDKAGDIPEGRLKAYSEKLHENCVDD